MPGVVNDKPETVSSYLTAQLSPALPRRTVTGEHAYKDCSNLAKLSAPRKEVFLDDDNDNPRND